MIGRMSTDVPRSLLRALRDGNAFETTVERLVRSIKLGMIVEGERLPSERALALALQVGRTTLREALEALRQADYVETKRGRGGGTFVTYAGPPSRADAAQLARAMGERLGDALDFRRVVEPGAAALAASRDISAADRHALLLALETCVHAASDRERRGADTRLHLMIAGLAGSDSLLSAVVDVQLRVGELLSAIPVLRRNIAHSDAQHADVVDAVLCGDTARARKAMEEHCDGTSALLRGFLS